MVPAREVGGDFYDFFLLDKDRLGFVIGDVSGKGVPAAIFMAVCRTLLKATALQNLSAGDCLKYVNDVLVRQSDAAMFVTIFYGILHTPTGELEYCSGGHNPPYIVSPNGDLRLLDEPRSLIVGALEQGTFQTGHTMLRAGECILLFTDGVTEAVDSSRCEFSDARLRTVLEQNSSSPVDQIVENVISEVRIFSSGLPQADDVTVMALRRTGS